MSFCCMPSSKSIHWHQNWRIFVPLWCLQFSTATCYINVYATWSFYTSRLSTYTSILAEYTVGLRETQPIWRPLRPFIFPMRRSPRTLRRYPRRRGEEMSPSFFGIDDHIPFKQAILGRRIQYFHTAISWILLIYNLYIYIPAYAYLYIWLLGGSGSELWVFIFPFYQTESKGTAKSFPTTW